MRFPYLGVLASALVLGACAQGDELSAHNPQRRDSGLQQPIDETGGAGDMPTGEGGAVGEGGSVGTGGVVGNGGTPLPGTGGKLGAGGGSSGGGGTSNGGKGGG